MADIEKKEKTKAFFLKHIWDFVLLVGLALGTASFFVIRSVQNSKKEEDQLIATVYKDNQKIDLKNPDGSSTGTSLINLSMIPSGVEKTYNVEGTKGKLVITAKYNSIHVESAECPGQECVHEGWVSHPNHPIICAYNHIFIEITSHNWEEIIVG